MMITLTYGLRTDGVNADEILSGDGNTIANDLISAVTTIVLSLIDEQSQGNKRLIKTIQNNGISDQSNSHVLIVHKNEVLERLKAPRRNGLISIQSYRDDKNEGSRRAVRKLVKYRPDTPVFHRSILQDSKSLFQKNDFHSRTSIKCKSHNLCIVFNHLS